jgi:hypothetical protein
VARTPRRREGRREKVAVPAVGERGSKRRLRSIKRESGHGSQGAPIHAAQGQRRAIRGARLRQRHT